MNGLDVIKALDTQTATEGSEFVPTDLSSELQEKMRLDRKVAGLFKDVKMPTNPYKYPLKTGNTTGYLVSESTGEDGTGQNRATASQMATSDLTLTAKKLMARTLVSIEEGEDSIVPIIPAIKSDLAETMTDTLEDALINGDDSTTHQDSNVTAATDRRKAWKGLRKLALAASLTQDLSTFNATNLRAMRKKMKKYGVNPANLAWITGNYGYQSFMDVMSDNDKYSTGKTLLQGQLGSFDGIPIIVSEYIQENLNTAGVYDGTTTNNTCVLLVYRPNFIIGTRRDVTVKSDENIEYDQVTLVAGFRRAFTPIFTVGSTDPTVVCGIDVAAA